MPNLAARSSRASRASLLRCCRLSLTIALLASSGSPLRAVATPLSKGAPGRPATDACVVVDNDYDIDDMMALPMVLASRRVAAVVQTEGVTLPAQAAPAVDGLLHGGGPMAPRSRIPVIVGAQPTLAPDLAGWPWLPFFRAMLNRSNGLLTAPPEPWLAEADLPRAIARAVSDCERVSVLLTAPFSSFIRYAPALRHKLDQVVITGRRLEQAAIQPADASFNCRYDLLACQAAVALLSDVPAAFVALPHAPECITAAVSGESCFVPSSGAGRPPEACTDQRHPLPSAFLHPGQQPATLQFPVHLGTSRRSQRAGRAGDALGPVHGAVPAGSHKVCRRRCGQPRPVGTGGPGV